MFKDNTTESHRENRARRQVGQIAKFLEVPANSVIGGAHIEMNGNRELFIEGCRGVVEYTETIIRVATADGGIKVIGRGMNLRNLTPDTLLVEGYILSVEFT